MGIPMTPTDDKGRTNSYPLMRVQAVSKISGSVLATVDAVVPVSSETDCSGCHSLGKVGADPSARTNGPQFIAATGTDRVSVDYAARINILRLHDFRNGTNLEQSQPVLCAGCHRSNALADVGGPGGSPALPSMSAVMHNFHGKLQVNASQALLRDASGNPILGTTNPPLFPEGTDVPMEKNCFQCHPGQQTQCFRGAMFNANLKCYNCHGGMLAVGAEYPLQSTGQKRSPWHDEPKCGACHTGIGSQPVKTFAYDLNDPSATPLQPVSATFAENTGELYRNSLGHHGVACESCHGSPHAIWPNGDSNANDNVTAMQLQGHVGTLLECGTCHSGMPSDARLGGPHGMHPVNDPTWIRGGNYWHGEVYE
jgi:hypothetical protein